MNDDDFGSFGDFISGMDMSDLYSNDGLRDRFSAKLTREAILQSFLDDALSDEMRGQVEEAGAGLNSAVEAFLTPFVVREDDPAGWMIDGVGGEPGMGAMMFLLAQARFILGNKQAVDMLVPLRNVLVVSGDGYLAVSDNVVDEMLDILERAEGDLLPYMAVSLMNIVREFGPEQAKDLLHNIHPDLSNVLYRFVNAFIGLYAEFVRLNNEVRERLFGDKLVIPGLDNEDEGE